MDQRWALFFKHTLLKLANKSSSGSKAELSKESIYESVLVNAFDTGNRTVGKFRKEGELNHPA